MVQNENVSVLRFSRFFLFFFLFYGGGGGGSIPLIPYQLSLEEKKKADKTPLIPYDIIRRKVRDLLSGKTCLIKAVDCTQV